MRYSSKIQGIAALEKALKKYDKDTGRAYAKGLTGVAREIYKESQDFVPVDTGALRASGDYWTAGTGWNAVGYVGYGLDIDGYERIPANYAVYQHDEPFMVKYLEDAVDNQADDAIYLFWQAIAFA
jgi:hypothetical protein